MNLPGGISKSSTGLTSSESHEARLVFQVRCFLSYQCKKDQCLTSVGWYSHSAAYDSQLERVNEPCS